MMAKQQIENFMLMGRTKHDDGRIKRIRKNITFKFHRAE
jgi:hypothetical protein